MPCKNQIRKQNFHQTPSKLLWNTYYWNRAEKSAESFREEKLVMIQFLNFSLLLNIFWAIAKQFNLSVFGLWGDAVQCYWCLNVKIIDGAILKQKIAWHGKEPRLKQLLDGFLSHEFLRKALGVLGACSPCSLLFSICIETSLKQPWNLLGTLFKLSFQYFWSTPEISL